MTNRLRVARPELLVLVCGTGTEVGKTWVTAQTSQVLRDRGVSVSTRKLAQSYDPDDVMTDADVLAEASNESPAVVCPPHRWYPTPMAPPIAAATLARPPFTVHDLVDEMTWPQDTMVGFVETAGGVRSPQADDGDVVDVIRLLHPDVVMLIANAALGTINAVRLCVSALPPKPLIVLNHYDETDLIHTTNREWLTTRDRLDVVCSVSHVVERLYL